MHRGDQPFEPAPTQRARGRELGLDVGQREHDRAQALQIQPQPEARVLGVGVRDAPALLDVRLDLAGVAVDADDVLVLLA